MLPQSLPTPESTISPDPSKDRWCPQENWEALPRRALDNPLLSSSNPAARKCLSWQTPARHMERTEILALKPSSPAPCHHRVHSAQRCLQQDLSAEFPALLFPSHPKANSAHAASKARWGTTALHLCRGVQSLVRLFLPVKHFLCNLAQPMRHWTAGGKISSVYVWTISQWP